MSYSFDKDAKDGDVVTLDNGVAYQYDAAKDRWLVKAVAGGGTGADWGFPLPDEQQGNYVSKVGGDEMEGPLKIKNNDAIDDSREARRLEVLNIHSGTENSSLNLGAKNTSVYIGANQTTFTKPIHVDDIKEKNDGEGVTFHNSVKLKVEGEAENEAVTKGYVDGADQHLKTLIDEIEAEVDIIAPRLEGASYTYSDSPAVKAGEMHVASGTFTSGTDLVLFNEVALDGKTHTWAGLNVGDYLELTDTQETRTAENYAMYLVTKAPEGSGMKQIEVALVKGQGVPTAGDVMDAKGFQLGGNEINDLDARYMRKDAYNTRLYRQEYVNSFGQKDWKTYSPAPGTFELAVNGSYSWETNQSLAFRDLYTIFPPDEWEFVPGFVTCLEMNDWSGFQYAPRWQMRMDNYPRFDAEGQVLRGWWRGENPNTSGRLYLRFECFRRK